MRVKVTEENEPIEISDDESESEDVQILEESKSAADPDLEAALAGLDADTEKQVHSVVRELNKHVEADMWKLAYENANEENKVNFRERRAETQINVND